MAEVRIRNNASGQIAARNLSNTQSKVSKTLEKLSSGYKINRSGDDAAGLAISEKMRAMITGLKQAERNSEDGLSLVNTGEAALTEIHTMLNRIVELSTTSANGTYRDELDRVALQRELNQIYDEVERIAKNSNFNGIKLFQDKGIEYENIFEEDVQAGAAESTSGVQTLDDVLAGTKAGEFNIIYTEKSEVKTTQSTEGAAKTDPSSIIIGGKNLSEILKTEIIPNTVKNILKSYPAFSYLNGSSIGIGLRYFSEGASGGTTTLAYVETRPGASGKTDGTGALVSRQDFLTYTLGVNTAVLANVKTRDDLQDLEATIAHEMIHAFMYEATTAGMSGKKAVSNKDLLAPVDEFPDWFVEGMAQTASGPDNWLRYMGITGTSTDAQITAAVKKYALGSGSTASQYGTGYLACMYLGAVIAGGGTPAQTVDAATVSAGLTKLFNDVVGGKSLDKTIDSLTKGKFKSCADFAAKFNSGSAEIGSFVRNLLQATGSGRGGIISGDLTAEDLTADDALGTSIKLFQLDTANDQVKNIYPENYPVYSGGTTGTDGVAPGGFTPSDPLPPIECGDLIVTGVKAADIQYDDSTGVLTVNSADDVKISMKTPGVSSGRNKIVLNGSGTVTLDGVQLSVSDALQINQAHANVVYKGKNTLGGIDLTAGVDVTFKGTGYLKADSLDSDASNTVRFDGGAVTVGAGGGGQINAGSVVIDKAAVSAVISASVKNPAGKELKAVELPWTRLRGIGDIVSIGFNGASSSMLIEAGGTRATLWLDPDIPKNIVAVTDVNGEKRTLAAVYNPALTPPAFEWLESTKPFTVTGGTEGTDWDYADDGRTLVIKTDKALTISGGTGTDVEGKDFAGRIRLMDGISGNVELTLDGIDSKVTSGSAFDLGAGNNVTLKLADGKTSTFTSGKDYAGIAVGAGTKLTIEGTDDGKLVARGGANSAGIGRSSIAKLTDGTSSITIKGGNIETHGGTLGAGIGAGAGSSFGDITIHAGTISANGGYGGAGIGGADAAKVGNIEIIDGRITAKSQGHGAGIGGGWGSSATNGDITIRGGTITASSTSHGTGIGAGCSGASGRILISGGQITAEGGNDGAGIGASWTGSCSGIEITGGEVNAKGGANGAGIGAGGDNSKIKGTITIDTDGTVTAEGGTNGVGIGSGYKGSSCGDILIKKGTVKAVGATDATGIGAGRDSTSGNVTVGDKDNPGNKVIVDAVGGMSNNGGNILSYGDRNHTQPGTLTIAGDNTTVRPGHAGEGLYSTSGAVNEGGDAVYAYPVYLYKTDPPLESGEGLDVKGLPLPDDVDINTVQIKASSKGGKVKEWTPGLIHEPENKYAFVWMTGEDQKLTITYKDKNGKDGSVTLDLKFYKDAGVFRIASQPKPEPAKKPGYVDDPPEDPVGPEPAPEPEPEAVDGIILQIGASPSDTLGIPRYYLSAKALNMDNMDITTQEKARNTMSLVGDAIDRVSSIRASYGALSKRLEHNQQYLNNTIENTQAAESRVRDADMAKEYMEYIRLTVNTQAAQAMLAHSNQDASQILQLLQ